MDYYKLFLWGTGNRTREFIDKPYLSENCVISGIVDTYSGMRQFMGYEVITPDVLPERMGQADYVVISNQYYADILRQCMELGIKWEKLVITDPIEEAPLWERFLPLKELAPKWFDLFSHRRFGLVKMNETDLLDKESYLHKERYQDSLYREDYFRYRTFEFAAREIKKGNIEGDVAELGVFRGTFAALINEVFQDRTLYLFDTFEGFERVEAEKELAEGRISESFISSHSDTSLHILFQHLPHPNQCRICKGLFPKSVTREAADAQFAFVSLDVDLEESTLEGLRFFYPRLTKGGYIFLHDYHAYRLEGIAEAVKRYESEIQNVLIKLPLADRAGTLVIMK